MARALCEELRFVAETGEQMATRLEGVRNSPGSEGRVGGIVAEQDDRALARGDMTEHGPDEREPAVGSETERELLAALRHAK